MSEGQRNDSLLALASEGLPSSGGLSVPRKGKVALVGRYAANLSPISSLPTRGVVDVTYCTYLRGICRPINKVLIPLKPPCSSGSDGHTMDSNAPWSESTTCPPSMLSDDEVLSIQFACAAPRLGIAK